MKHFAFGLLATSLAVSPAVASVADYCAAYARDMADLATARGGNEAQWQQHIADHTRACTTRFAPEKTAAPRKPVKPVKLAAVKKPVTKPTEKVVTKAVKPAPVVAPQKLAKLAPALTPGSTAWNDYCKKKYVSFNIATGTYTSLTGVERKCLVTAE